MEWIGPGILCLVLTVVSARMVLRRRQRRLAGLDAVVQFDLAMPEKWAAELVQSTLENEGRRSKLGRDGEEWICRVTVVEALDAGERERRRAHYDQIAAARGGECRRFHVFQGDKSVTYEAAPSSRRV